MCVVNCSIAEVVECSGLKPCWSGAEKRYLLIVGKSKDARTPFSVCARRCGSGCLYSILAVQVRWGSFYGAHFICSSHPVYLLVQVPHGVCGIQ